ncbi:type IX secretion system membrane protein PorP/SprF [Pedobacter sp. WC2423]|uniref:PorP/SprF family type IX secretion system membrane protein n=1 Tax=Pedobacter sp. WC2423 TaxID=3234142 RepID=UPI003466D33C
MRTVFLILTGVFLFKVSNGQQRPQYTQYIFNNYLLNPALSGIENYTDVRVGSRVQWAGINDGPVTSFFSVHAPLGKQYLYGNSSSFAEKGANPMERSYLQNYMAAEPHHGIGVFGTLDKAGPVKTLDIKASYAYHLGLSSKMNLSVGVAAGISRISLDISKLNLENSADPAIAPGFNSRTQPDLDAGIWLYGPDFFAGVSVQQLLNKPLSFSDSQAAVQGKQVPHLFVTAGYKFFLSEEVSVTPSVMLKKVQPAPLSADLNFKIAFKDKLWIGGSYRPQDAVSAMAGFNINSLFVLSYAYDFTTSELGAVSKGTHEVVLGILLNNRYKVTCPQRNW